MIRIVNVLALLSVAVLAQDKSATYRLPWEEGKSYPVWQGNGGNAGHVGLNQYAFDFGLPEGSKVCAARGGKVVEAPDDETGPGEGKYGGQGNHVTIDHGDGTNAIYMHLKNKSVFVKPGETVMQGDVVGLSGQTGRASGPHLHFEVNRGSQSIATAFEDVETDAGVPKEGKSYTSRNTPGIPAATKDKLSVLSRTARMARQEGAPHLAYRAAKLIAAEKLKVAYAPQEEAKKMLAESDAAAESTARTAREKLEHAYDEAVRELLLAKPLYVGTPKGNAITDALAEAKKNPRFDEVERGLKNLLRQEDFFLKGLKLELEGKPAAARPEYKGVLVLSADSEYGKRAAAALKRVDEALQPPSPRPPGK